MGHPRGVSPWDIYNSFDRLTGWDGPEHQLTGRLDSGSLGLVDIVNTTVCFPEELVNYPSCFGV